MAKKEKTFTKDELMKAIDESYSLGFKHGRDKSTAAPTSIPGLSSEIQITQLTKNIGDNAKKIGEQLLKRHREATEKHIRAFTADANMALDEVLEAAKQHNHSKK